jgi:RNA polymerase sigma-70 factor (ECF subfamily)
LTKPPGFGPSERIDADTAMFLSSPARLSLMRSSSGSKHFPDFRERALLLGRLLHVQQEIAVSESSREQGVFATTHWSVVLSAGDSAIPGAREALEKLCRTYWYPLYAYVRRRGHDAHEAQDLTQEFFVRFLASHTLQSMDRNKGRFRSFLLAAMNHFLANEWKRGQTLKRGGAVTFLSRDEAIAEERYRLEPATDLTPEKIYERRWALTLLDQVLQRLREEYVSAGKGELFDHLRTFLSDAKGAMSYAEAAAKTGISEAAARQAVHRLRQRYRESMRAEIAHTVSSPQEVEEELRHLFAVFGTE